MRLKDKVAIVTGGSRGIGRGIVQALAAEGAKVAIVYRGSQPAADELVASIGASGGTAKAFQCDVAEFVAVEACVKKVEEELGPIDIRSIMRASSRTTCSSVWSRPSGTSC